MSRHLFILLITLCCCEVHAAESVGSDSTHRGIIGRIIDYFGNANRPREHDKFDISFIGGPHYSSDSKFGIGLVAAGAYNLDHTDTLDLYRSNVAVKLDMTTAKHFKLEFEGENIFPEDRSRLAYSIELSSVETRFWGIGYDECHDDASESHYRYLAVDANLSQVWRIAPQFYVGPLLVVNYTDGRKFAKPEMWGGEPNHAFSWGTGISLRYDTRDCLTEPHTGVALRLDQQFRGRWLGNSRGFNVNEFTASAYKPVWKGGILAGRVHWRCTWGDTPWCFLSTIGGSDNMRGYFDGRYRDKNEADICVELRQHVWRRNGIVCWVGAATLFPRFSDIEVAHVLPNAGIGYRWEFKDRMNVRVDLGFGRHQTGFIFSINEAF